MEAQTKFRPLIWLSDKGRNFFQEPTAAAAGEASQGNNEVPSAEGDSSQGAKEVSGSEPETSRRGSISPEGRVLTLTAELEQLRNDVAELLQRSQG